MKNKLFFAALLFLSIFFVLNVSAICEFQCYYKGDCKDAGDVAENKYCDPYTLQFINQKPINQTCVNDFECISGNCIEDKCIDYAALIKEAQDMQQAIANFSQYKDKVNCTSSPGCLNVSTVSFAHVTGALCIGRLDYKCFTCDSDYVWNISSCILKNCDTSPGCRNISSFTSLSNYQNRSLKCSTGFQCIKCSDGYSWNSSSGNCEQIIDYNPNLGFWTFTKTITSSQFADGFSMKLYAKHRIKFVINGVDHYVGIREVLANSVKIEVASSPQLATMNVGEEKKFEVTSDNYYDVRVKINSITGKGVDITVKALHEIIPDEDINPVNPPSDDTIDVDSDSDKKDYTWIIWVVVGILAVIILVAIIFLIIFLTGENKNQKKEVWAKKDDQKKTQEVTGYTYAYNPNSFPKKK